MRYQRFIPIELVLLFALFVKTEGEKRMTQKIIMANEYTLYKWHKYTPAKAHRRKMVCKTFYNIYVGCQS